MRALLAVGALVVTHVCLGFCCEALAQPGTRASTFIYHLAGQASAVEEASPVSLGAVAVLGLGFVFGLKHATEVDHVVAVSTIVSEYRSISRAALVGGLWGVGHTASLIGVGAVVLALRVSIPERITGWLEFCVALMIIGLGANALVRALRGRTDVHVHRHSHDGFSHVHIHFHERGTEHAGSSISHSHSISRIGLKPLVV
ncbi:MAG TPA: hypothetical protein VD966_00710, partial [Pyrinomonadaceae bacterium]|nr:hypothetical protein [Pyrinomonadaceae bacterium]